MNIIRLLLAMGFDILDAISIIPIAGDLAEGPAHWFASTALGIDDELLKLITIIDGFLPPPFDLFPSLTAVVIYQEIFKKNV